MSNASDGKVLFLFTNICDDGSPFWNQSLSWDTDAPKFPPCLINTGLSWPPMLLLWILGPYFLYHYLKAGKNSVSFPLYWRNVAKMILALILLMVGLFHGIHVTKERFRQQHLLQDDDTMILNYVSKAQVISKWLAIGTYGLFFVLLILQRRSGFINCGCNWFYLLVSIPCDVLSMFSEREHRSRKHLFFKSCECFIKTVLFFLFSFADNVPRKSDEMSDGSNVGGAKKKKCSRLCPEDTASLPNKLTFWWYTNLVIKGWRRPLTEDDIWNLSSKNQSKNLFELFNQSWRHPLFCRSDNVANGCGDHQKKDHQPKRPTKVNLWRMLTKMYWWEFFFPTLARLVTDVSMLLNLIVLKFMIYFCTNPDSPWWQGILFSFFFMLINVTQSLSSAYYQNRMIKLSLRLKFMLTSAIYRKTLVLAMHARKQYTAGELINLVSVDTRCFKDSLPWISYLWSAPIEIVIGICLLWHEFGASALCGTIILVATIPINYAVARKTARIYAKNAKLKDERLRNISEMLNGMKVLKLYAWEEAFFQVINKIRRKELRSIKILGWFNLILELMENCFSVLICLVTFSLYTMVGHQQLNAEQAFVSIALFNTLRTPVILIPHLISNVSKTIVSVKRMNRFLNLDENQNYVQRKPMKTDSVAVSGASFSWGLSNTDPLTLQNITVRVPKNKLVAVVGPVGSGKSSFLHAILGEMYKHQGTVSIDDQQTMAFVPQQAWIQNLTLRDNVLFGHRYDPAKYAKVIEACALGSDLKILPAGDLTEIGEKGINLSGGQKQRVSIARACYSESNLFLLDDPLSAVDSHVGKHIFEEVLSNDRGILKNKTRILVTNALYLLPLVDEVILIKNGRIEDIGSYQRLLATNKSFQELINSFAQSNQDIENTALQDMDGFEQCPAASEQQTNGNAGQQASANEKKESWSEPKSSGSQMAHAAKLVEVENVETGKISLNAYKKFIWTLSPMWFTLIICNYFFSVATHATSDIWVSFWTKDPADSGSIKYLTIYSLIGLCRLVFETFAWLSIIFGTLNSSRFWHRKFLSSMVHAPMHFFESTPLGRIMNRFSTDMEILDYSFRYSLRILLQNSFIVLTTLAVISYVTPKFSIFVLPFIFLYYCMHQFYVSTSRQLKRIETTSNSPVFSHFSETIQGVSTIRAYGVVDRFIEESNVRMDNNFRCFHASLVANYWLQVRLEFLADCMIFSASLIAALARDSLTGSQIGLSLTYALNLTGALDWCVRMFTEIENNLVAVERIAEYANVPPEAAWYNEFDKTLKQNWPDRGEIEFRKYSTRYRPGLDLVLKGVDLSIKEGEKIGIVGRTGAGKSSLTLALFRILEACQGCINVDDVDISKLGLQKLRSRITIIPQDPVLFCGTLRFNLDPFDNFSDQQLWKVLELSHLKSFVQGLESGLGYSVSGAGENLSVGQRQLVCLARALLRRSNLLVLDEATAAVDLETDTLIQETIRKEFTDCTVLTIAHRLHTIIDSDRVLVLDAGRVAEFDSPKSLLDNNRSIFYSLAKDSGLVT